MEKSLSDPRRDLSVWLDPLLHPGRPIQDLKCGKAIRPTIPAAATRIGSGILNRQRIPRLMSATAAVGTS